VRTSLLLYISPLVVSAGVLVGLLAVTWRNRADAIAPWFAGTLVAFLIWTVGYIFEITSSSLAGKLLWANLQFVGIALLPIMWFAVVRRYTGRAPLARPLVALVAAFFVVSMVVVFADPGGTFRGSPRLDTDASPSVLVPDYGWYWAFIFMPVCYLLLCVSIAMLAQSIWRDGQSLYRRQYALLIVAAVLPLLAGTLYVFGVEPAPGLNPTTAVVSVSGAIMAYALFRYRLFDIAPLARGAVVDGLCDGMIVLDVYDRIVDFNPAATRLFPDVGRAALGRPVSEVLAFHPGLLESIGQAAAGRSAPDTVVAELSMSLPGDWSEGGEPPESRHFTVALSAVRGRKGRLRGHSVMFHDVTRSVELLRQVERLATTDPLTELMTRKAFLEIGEKEMTRARRQGFAVWIVLLDLDDFALVNELYGGDVGDEVLRAVAGACRRILRAFDVMGRFAGEEFVLLLPHLSRTEAEETAEALRRAVEGLAVWKDDQLVNVTASVGVAGVEHAETEYLTDLLAPAEWALKQAREQGSNRVVSRRAE
jgi:diguanylate cyclase (GGDEF)-like protein